MRSAKNDRGDGGLLSIAEAAKGESISAGCLYAALNPRQERQYWSRVRKQEQAGRQDDFQPNTAHVQYCSRVQAREGMPYTIEGR
jgi:hypothetical protein